MAELGTERRVSVSFSLTDREAFLAKVADAPITTGLEQDATLWAMFAERGLIKPSRG